MVITSQFALFLFLRPGGDGWFVMGTHLY